jgi:hypothetical protein
LPQLAFLGTEGQRWLQEAFVEKPPDIQGGICGYGTAPGAFSTLHTPKQAMLLNQFMGRNLNLHTCPLHGNVDLL